jgi:hypothetical protein
MAKDSNIIHQYFKKEEENFKILVKVNPITFFGSEITIGLAESPDPQLRELEFDEEIFEDLKADGFIETNPMEFNLYAVGLLK